MKQTNRSHERKIKRLELPSSTWPPPATRASAAASTFPSFLKYIYVFIDLNKYCTSLNGEEINTERPPQGTSRHLLIVTKTQQWGEIFIVDLQRQQWERSWVDLEVRSHLRFIFPSSITTSLLGGQLQERVHHLIHVVHVPHILLYSKKRQMVTWIRSGCSWSSCTAWPMLLLAWRRAVAATF